MFCRHNAGSRPKRLVLGSLCPNTNATGTRKSWPCRTEKEESAAGNEEVNLDCTVTSFTMYLHRSIYPSNPRTLVPPEPEIRTPADTVDCVFVVYNRQ